LGQARGLTQKQVAELLDTKQQAIARLEDPAYTGHSLTMVRRYVEALGASLQINVVPASNAADHSSAWQPGGFPTTGAAGQAETRVRLCTLDLPLLLKPSDHDLFQGFFVPALSHALRDDHGMGYFASGWLWLTKKRRDSMRSSGQHVLHWSSGGWPYLSWSTSAVEASHCRKTKWREQHDYTGSNFG
jgi:transcriptional regulator with XRE-family HTH domain